MLTKIDWMSFTLMLPEYSGDDERYVEANIATALDALDPGLEAWMEMGQGWVRTKGRAPYSIAWTHPLGGFTVFYHTRLNHCLFEVSGKGCDFLQSRDILVDFLDIVQQRLTRLDIACDMLTDVRPLDFVQQRDQKRFKSHGEQFSESGETCYVGSRSSNRYARVYRYNPPHERAHLLRCEFVVKAEDAKATAYAVLNDGLHPVSKSLGEKFGWLHPVWQPSATEAAELAAYRPDRREGKTIFWLADTVAPLIRRLHEEGTLNAFAWFEENIARILNGELTGEALVDFLAAHPPTDIPF